MSLKVRAVIHLANHASAGTLALSNIVKYKQVWFVNQKHYLNILSHCPVVWSQKCFNLK